jgi:hypothetical protein
MSWYKFTLLEDWMPKGPKAMWMNEKCSLNALWRMFHGLEDFMPSPLLEVGTTQKSI